MRRIVICFTSGLLFITLWLCAIQVVGGQVSPPAKAPYSAQHRSKEDFPNGESGETPVDDLGEYYKVLDALFAGGSATRPTDSIVLAVRYIPTGEPESELLMRRPRNGKATIHFARAESSVYEMMQDALNEGRPIDPASIMERVAVRRKRIEIDTQQSLRLVEDLLNNYEKSVRLISEEFVATESTGVAKLYVDAAEYRISLTLHGWRTLSVVLDGPEIPVGSSDEALPIVRAVSRLLEFVQEE